MANSIKCTDCDRSELSSYTWEDWVCPECINKRMKKQKQKRTETVIMDDINNEPEWLKEHEKRTQEINAGIVQMTKAKSDKVGTGLILIPLYSLLALGKIFIEGLRYGRDNWKKGVNDTIYQEERLEHAFLHLIKYKEGDRSEAHLAKVAWFCFTQLELERLENESRRDQEPKYR